MFSHRFFPAPRYGTPDPSKPFLGSKSFYFALSTFDLKSIPM
jgi:hypothetical protein